MTTSNGAPLMYRRTAVLCWTLVIGAILLGCVGAYWPLAALPENSGLLGAFDVFMAYGPWLYFTDHRIHDGEFPLWDPLTMCGQPFAANPQNLLFYPPNLVRSALTFDPTPLRTHIGFAVLIVMHLLVGAIGVAALARKHSMGWAGACTAAVAFATSSQYVERLVRHPVFILTIAWLPWLLLASIAVHSASDSISRYRAAIGTGMLFGLVTLAGFPQLIIYCTIVLFIFHLLQALSLDANSHPHPPFHLLRFAVPFVLIVGIGGALAAASFLPAEEYAALSARQKGRELNVDDYVENVYTPARVLRSFIVYPGLEGSSLKIAGTAALMLAMAAVWHPKRRIVLVHAVLLYACIDCAIGPPMPVATVAAWLTPFRIVYPDYACFIACLPLAMLVGMGADALGRSTSSFIARFPVFVIAVATYGIACTTVDDVPIRPTTVAVIIPGILFCVLAAASIERLKQPASVAAAILVLAEACVWTPAFIPYLIDKWGAPPMSIDTLKESKPFWSDNRRGATYTPNTNLYDMQAIINGYNPLFIEDTYQAVCPPNMEDRYTWWLQLEVLQNNARGNLFLKRPFWLARDVVLGPLPPKETFFVPTTTAYLESSPGLGIPLVPPGEARQEAISQSRRIAPVRDRAQLAALKTAPTMNRFGKLAVEYRIEEIRHPGKQTALKLAVDTEQTVVIVGSITELDSNRKHFLMTTRVAVNAGETNVAEILLPDVKTFDLDLTLLIHPSAPQDKLTKVELLIDEADEDDLIEIVERSANSVRLNVGSLPGPRVLVFNESFYPGWSAKVDRTATDIIRTNDAFMGIALPEGTHEVVFKFRPYRVRIGIIISTVTFAMSCIGLLVLSRARRNLIHTRDLN